MSVCLEAAGICAPFRIPLLGERKRGGHIALILFLAAASARAQSIPQERREVDRNELRFHSMAIWQGYPGFPAQISGASSLPAIGQGREAAAMDGNLAQSGTCAGLRHQPLLRHRRISQWRRTKAGNRWPRQYIARVYFLTFVRAMKGDARSELRESFFAGAAPLSLAAAAPQR